MLEGLTAVDWGRYFHAYGPATDVPGLLRAIAAPGDDHDFERATGTLWSHVLHQGNVWGASAQVIPFLVEILKAPAPLRSRRFAVQFLHHLAVGHPHEQFPEPFDVDGLEQVAADFDTSRLSQSMLDGNVPEDLSDDDDPWLAQSISQLWMRDCYAGVEAHLRDMLTCLGDADDELVTSVLALTAEFPRATPVTAPVLWKVAQQADATRAAIALVSLAVLRQPRVAEAARVLSDAATGSARVYLAFADLIASPADVSAPSQHVLLTASATDEFCPFTGSRKNLINRALVLLPEAAASRVVEQLGVRLAAELGPTKLATIDSLLTCARISNGQVDAAVQRRALALVVEHGAWGTPEQLFQRGLLVGRGLPADRAALAALATSR